jgi:anaerobic magnesium-protoporphyrin IX monomethyl ester cyclase
MLSVLVAHSYFQRFDQKQCQRAKPYPPLATLQVAAGLRQSGHAVSVFDAMLAEGTEVFDTQLEAVRPELVLLYEDTFNFLSKMCLSKMRHAACAMIASARRAGARVIAAGPDASDAPEVYLAAGAELVLIGVPRSMLWQSGLRAWCPVQTPRHPMAESRHPDRWPMRRPFRPGI